MTMENVFSCCDERQNTTTTSWHGMAWAWRGRRIVLAELVPDPEHDNKPSRKYLSLVVDLGNEKRRVVSAVRSIVDVEDAIG